jgi:uncharacterized protein YcnI
MNRFFKYGAASGVAAVTSLVMMGTAWAHVVVKPAQVGVGSFQTFTTGVPNEQDQPTTGLRVVIPASLNYVSPNVKPGWTVNTKTTGEGESAKVTEITWTGGSVPAGQRDDFLFSAQVPAKAGDIQWKAYQTYADGTVVAWDQAPAKDADDESVKPYSTTQVVNDLAAASRTSSTPTDNRPLYLSLAAVVVALLALVRSTRKA